MVNEKKFDLEVDGKAQAVSFRRPTYKQKMDYLRTILPLQKEATAFQKEVESGDIQNPEKGIQMLEALNKARLEILLSLHVGEKFFQKPEDFQPVANKDLEAMYTWLQDEMGLNRTKTEEDFLSNSGK